VGRYLITPRGIDRSKPLAACRHGQAFGKSGPALYFRWSAGESVARIQAIQTDRHPTT
jgi:hypothetical protein